MTMRPYDLREQKQFGKRLFLFGDSCPQTPGIYRFPARMAVLFGAADAAPPFRPLGRRSGRIPAEPYLPPR